MTTDLGTCPRCGIRRAHKPERGVHLCRDCPPEKSWDDPLCGDDLTPIQWVREGLVWRPSVDGPVENALGAVRSSWDNKGTRKDGPDRGVSAPQPGPKPTVKEST